MMILAVLILINVLIVVIFRMYPRYGIRNLKAIILNYFICFITGSLILGHPAIGTSVIHEPWLPYALVISGLFITIFNVVALAVQKVGLIITGIFQKLSLIFPFLIGVWLFEEASSVLKWSGVGCGVLAIIMINYPDRRDIDYFNLIKKYWYLPLLILAGTGTIESVLFYVDEMAIVPKADIGFVSACFLFAGLWGLLYCLVTNNRSFSRRDVLGGIALGVPNFFTIYLLLFSLNQGWDGSELFPVLNVSVLALTAFVGLVFFGESLNRMNALGILLAIFCVLLISI